MPRAYFWLRSVNGVCEYDRSFCGGSTEPYSGRLHHGSQAAIALWTGVRSDRCTSGIGGAGGSGTYTHAASKPTALPSVKALARTVVVFLMVMGASYSGD